VFCSLSMSTREKKFALVDFHELREVEIVPVKDIVTEHDRRTLNGHEWNADTDVKVMWLKKGQKMKKCMLARFYDFQVGLHATYCRLVFNYTSVSL